jgi:hypothetical protein
MGPAVEADLDRRDGMSAVDRGANAPNVFRTHARAMAVCRISRATAATIFMQARFIEAMIAHFDPAARGGARNPTSDVYAGPMVDPARLHMVLGCAPFSLSDAKPMRGATPPGKRAIG